MKPIDFLEANVSFGPPPGFSEEQVATVRAHRTTLRGGSCDGAEVVVTAWRPSDAERLRLAAGAPVFLTFMGGGLPPHAVTTSFDEAMEVARPVRERYGGWVAPPAP
jgi:hypothetical protein